MQTLFYEWYGRLVNTCCPQIGTKYISCKLFSSCSSQLTAFLLILILIVVFIWYRCENKNFEIYEGGKKLLGKKKWKFISLEFINFWNYNLCIWIKIEIGAYLKFSMDHLFSSWKFHFYFCLIEKFFTPFLWFENRCLFSVINSKPKMRMVYAVRCSNLK